MRADRSPKSNKETNLIGYATYFVVVNIVLKLSMLFEATAVLLAGFLETFMAGVLNFFCRGTPTFNLISTLFV